MPMGRWGVLSVSIVQCDVGDVSLELACTMSSSYNIVA